MNDSNSDPKQSSKTDGTDPGKAPMPSEQPTDPLRGILNRRKKPVAPDSKTLTTSIYELFKRLLIALRRFLRLDNDRTNTP